VAEEDEPGLASRTLNKLTFGLLGSATKHKATPHDVATLEKDEGLLGSTRESKMPAHDVKDIETSEEEEGLLSNTKESKMPPPIPGGIPMNSKDDHDNTIGANEVNTIGANKVNTIAANKVNVAPTLGETKEVKTKTKLVYKTPQK
jgi:hypothetical protein